jgi:hypothetical protein
MSLGYALICAGLAWILGETPTKGIALQVNTEFAAGPSPRLTSGGEAKAKKAN